VQSQILADPSSSGASLLLLVLDERPACDETVQFARNCGSVVVAAVATACGGS